MAALIPVALANPGCSPYEELLGQACVEGDGDSFNGLGGAVGEGRDERGGQSGTGVRPVGGRPVVRTVTAVAPICQGNTPEDGNTVCAAAIGACVDEGDIAYWVWRQEVPVGQSPDPAEWRKVLDPAYVCKGPTDPALNPRQAIAGIVQREFASYDITRARLVVDPEGETLVGFRTRFWTEAGRYTFTKTILGQRVDITATPERYVFHFGDGTTATRTTAPRPGTDDLVHSYARPGSEPARVDVTWSGTYVIAGNPEVLSVRGTATTTGPTTAVTVREARSQYEGG